MSSNDRQVNLSASTLERFSSLLYELYPLIDISDAETFQSHAMAVAAKTLEFDSGLWGSGVVTENGQPLVHAIYLHNQPPSMMTDWEKIKHLDLLMGEVLNNVGRTVVASAQGLRSDRSFDQRVQRHCERYEMRHILSTVFVDPVSRLLNAVSFFRANSKRPFLVEDALIKQCLMPHLACMWSASRLATVGQGKIARESKGSAIAICDRMGILHAASREFLTLIRAEWSGWQGPSLAPLEVHETPRTFSGKAVVFEVRPLNDLRLITARHRTVVDQLSRRELEVAKLFSTGLNYQSVAKALYIAPTTVRNHLKNIYQKLGINTKVELVRILKLGP